MKEKLGKKGILALCAVPAAVVLLIVLLARPKKVDPTPYLETTFTGLDGEGTAYVDLDYDALIEQVLPMSSEDLESFSEYFWEYESLQSGIILEYEPREGLSNGDKITVTIECEGKAAKKFKSTKETFRVEGLTEITEVDPFDYVEFTFQGMSGEAELRVGRITEEEGLNQILYTAEPSSRLQSGDKVTVTASLPDHVTREIGYVLSKTEMTLTVPELDRYITDPADISEALVQEIADYYIAVYDGYEDFYDHFDTPKYYGSYLSVAKDQTTWHEKNVLIVYIGMDGYSNRTDEPTGTYHIGICFEDLVVKTDGTIDLDIENGNHYMPLWSNELEDLVAKWKNESYVLYELGL